MKLWALIAGIFIIAGSSFALGYFSNTSISSEKTDLLSFKYQTMEYCINNYRTIIQPSKIDNNFLGQTASQCYVKIHGQWFLNNDRIISEKYIQQAYDERVLLWMVVIITISGVGLAGLQLLASYHLATDGKSNLGQSGELLIENKKVSLKSSITGVFILLLSFAFFFVFVIEIYHIKGEDEKYNKIEQMPPQLTTSEIERPKETNYSKSYKTRKADSR